MSRTPSTTALAFATLLAAALLAVGGILSVQPGVLLGAVPELEALLVALDPGLAVLALVLVLVVVAPTVGIAGRLRSSSTTPLVTPAEESGSVRSQLAEEGDDYPVVGESFDRRIERATGYDDHARSTRETARERLVESLRPIAATAYANRVGLTEAEATAAIEDGTWTADPRAAAFLAGDDGPSTPLWLWLIDLVSTTDPFVRSLERTIDEIDRLQSTPTVTTESTTGSADSVGAADAEVAS